MKRLVGFSEKGGPLSISVSTNSQAVMGAVNVMMTRKTMDIALDQNAQLLQSLPQAPGPAHMGQNVDLFA